MSSSIPGRLPRSFMPLDSCERKLWPREERLVRRRLDRCALFLVDQNDRNLPHDEETPKSTTFTFGGDGQLVESVTFTDRYSGYLPEWLLNKCLECGWKHPTRIQQQALDVLLIDQDDAVIQAQTGSGKTLAYLLPCLAGINPRRAAVQALIVVPTRELGLQVARVAKRLAAASAQRAVLPSETDKDGPSSAQKGGDKIMVMSVLQGSQNRRQRAWAWAEPPHVVIGTPQELCNMVRLGGIKRYNTVKYVVVDEVDACLLHRAAGHSDAIADLLTSSAALHELLSKYLSPTFDDGSSTSFSGMSTADFGTSGGLRAALSASDSGIPSTSSRPLSNRRQTVFCSATLPQPKHFIKQCVQNQWTLKPPVHVCLQSGEQLLPDTLSHAYVVCATMEKKLASLRRLLKKIHSPAASSNGDEDPPTPAKILIFADPHRPLQDIAKVLAADQQKGIVWKESYGPEEERSSRAIFSVLQQNDNLTQRAAAMSIIRDDGVSSAWSPSSSWSSSSAGSAGGGRSSAGQPSTDADSDSNSNNPSSATLRVMLTTDLAARGLDIQDLTHVIQFDLPVDADTYVHRAGRTGRLGRTGQVISIITASQEFVLRRLANKLSLTQPGQMRCIARQQPSPTRGVAGSESTESND